MRSRSQVFGYQDRTLHVTEDGDFLGAAANALGFKKLQVVETGGDQSQQEREQWDDGNNVVALEPGVVVDTTVRYCREG